MASLPRLIGALAALPLFFIACHEIEDPGDAVGDANCASLQISLLLPERVSTAPLTVRGTVVTPNGDAIEAVVVASRSAVSEAFNFRIFSLTLERSDLLSLPRLASADDLAAGGFGGTSADTAERARLPVSVVLTKGTICSLPADKFTIELAIPDADGSDGDGASAGDTAGTGGTVGAGGSSSVAGAPGGGSGGSGAAGAAGN